MVKRTMTKAPLSRLVLRVCGAMAVAVAVMLVLLPTMSAQVGLPSGQNIAPADEGGEQNPDGTLSLVVGDFNRNWEEEIDLPGGADNQLEPGNADQGQPTHFFPRRNR